MRIRYLLAAAVLAVATIASPAMAGDRYHRGHYSHNGGDAAAGAAIGLLFGYMLGAQNNTPVYEYPRTYYVPEPPVYYPRPRAYYPNSSRPDCVHGYDDWGRLHTYCR